MIKRLWRRWRCHHTLVCCQYVDGPTCNSARDTHRLGRNRYWRHMRQQAREDGRV